MSSRSDNFFLQTRFFERFVNSFLQLHFLWDRVVRYESFGTEGESGLLKKVVLKLFWFWPRLVDAEQWRDANFGKRRDPSHFVEVSKGEFLLVDEVVEASGTADEAILDLGCNSGRFLNELHKRGYGKLHGVDISDVAQKYMGVAFSGLDEVVDFHCMTFQEYLSKASDGAVSIIYTRGATVELIHPSFPLIRHLCRVASKKVIFMFNESGHSYPRFWEWEFNVHGFYMSKAIRPVSEDASQLSLLVFDRSP